MRGFHYKPAQVCWLLLCSRYMNEPGVGYVLPSVCLFVCQHEYTKNAEKP